MATLQELIAQKEALNQQIAEAQRQAKADGIAKVRALMAGHNLTVADLSQPRATGKSAGKGKGQKVAPKYRDPETGKTWTGRGVAPKWIAGKDRGAYLIRE
jgi:DNA-binding protein H-NS